MKTLWSLAVLVWLAVCAMPLSLFAEPGAADGRLIEVGNKICPVSGEGVGTMGGPLQVEYKGKLYNLCCAGCEGVFLADPEKYIAKIEDQELELDRRS